MQGIRTRARRLEPTKEKSPAWGWGTNSLITRLTVSSDTVEFPPFTIPARTVQTAGAYSTVLPGHIQLPWTITLRLRTQDAIYDLMLNAKAFRALQFPFPVRHDSAHMVPPHIDRTVKLLIWVLAAVITLFIRYS